MQNLTKNYSNNTCYNNAYQHYQQGTSQHGYEHLRSCVCQSSEYVGQCTGNNESKTVCLGQCCIVQESQFMKNYTKDEGQNQLMNSGYCGELLCNKCDDSHLEDNYVRAIVLLWQGQRVTNLIDCAGLLAFCRSYLNLRNIFSCLPSLQQVTTFFSAKVRCNRNTDESLEGKNQKCEYINICSSRFFSSSLSNVEF